MRVMQNQRLLALVRILSDFCGGNVPRVSISPDERRARS